jgi:hypothetical protein
MSISDAIFSRAGRIIPFGTAMRIPIEEQDGFNTLVVIQINGAPGIPNVSINVGDTMRFRLSMPSTFLLIGFDQRNPPAFRHSTAGFLSYMATSDDATWIYAVDSVSARFDETGRYWIDYTSALLNDREIAALSFSLTSWVLVHEPPIQKRRGTRGLPAHATAGPLTVPANGLSLSIDAFCRAHPHGPKGSL